MPHSLMTESPSPLMMHRSQQPAATTAAAAVSTSLASELIHASLVAASHSAQPQDHFSAPAAPDALGSAAKASRNSCVAAPRMSTTTLATLEYSVHVSPRRFTRDMTTVFPNQDLADLLVVPTFQKTKHEMVAWDAEIAKEKDDRLEDFVRWATALHTKMEKLGYWSDMTDPASGFPCFSERGRDVYPDVEGCQLLLKYDFQNAGCCKILMHPIWGSKIYPATFFTTAPLEELLRVLEEVEQENRLSNE